MSLKKNSSKDLKNILNGCLAQKEWAFEQLFSMYYSFAKKISMKYAGKEDEVDEMVNDGFLKVFAKLHLYDNSKSFDAWFRTVIVRTCIDYYRKNSPKVHLLDVQEVNYIPSSENILDKLAAEDILELVQKLPPSYRMVFSLYVVEGYSHGDIAEALNINEGTSRSNLAKARIKLQEWIKIYLKEPINQDSHVRE